MANTKLTKTLEQGVSPDFGEVPAEVAEEPAAPEGKPRGRRKKPLGVPCRVCMMPLGMKAEKAIGVHIWCVANSRFKRVNIPGPRYGTRKQ